MTKQEKLQLLEELVKEGRITLCQAFELTEPEKEYVYVPTTNPWNDPFKPFQPTPNWQQPFITFATDNSHLGITTLTTRS